MKLILLFLSLSVFHAFHGLIQRFVFQVFFDFHKCFLMPQR